MAEAEQEVALAEEEQLEQEGVVAEPEHLWHLWDLFLGGGVEVHDEILDSSNEDSGLGMED